MGKVTILHISKPARFASGVGLRVGQVKILHAEERSRCSKINKPEQGEKYDDAQKARIMERNSRAHLRSPPK